MTAPTISLPTGSVFHDRYEILAPLGEGGMGVVYKARDRSLDEAVAIKILRPEFAQDPVMAERFKGEIRLARKVRHRNVCTIHDYGEDQGRLFISMELVDGVDVKRILREGGAFPPSQAYDIALQVAEGLQAVHEAGIIHRDLKTPNLIRDASGTVRLMDFGIAKRYGEATLTATGNIMGTPEYMSPEQAQGHSVDFRSDVYALGVVIYELFTGRVPFKGDTPISTILKQLNEPPPLDVPPTLPAELKPILRRCLAKDPEARPSSARQVAEGLRRARERGIETGPTVRPTVRPTVAMPVVPDAPPRRLRPAFAALPVIAAAAIAGVWWAGQRREAEPAAPAVNPVLASPAETPPVVSTAPPTLAPSASAASPPATPTPRPASPSPQPRKSAPAVLATAPAPSPTPSPPAATPRPAASAVEPAGSGWLLVVVRPWGEVSVDGRPVGTTPLERFQVPSGTHTLTVRHPAYPPLTRQVVVRRDETARIVVDLPRDAVRPQ